ncbi:MAG: BT4734/BF3469 family protein [Ginsengibacter sp.]
MNWIDKQVSFYKNHFDNIGRPATYRQILFSFFGDCFPIIYQLRQLENDKIKKSELKSKLPGFAPAALLQQRTAGKVIEIERTGIMQLDFDYVDIQDYDIEELKQAVFHLPFIGFCGLSCSGRGFFALAMIAEPERLNEYADHVFNVLIKYGIKPDTSKGRNVNDLRYLSYDCNMLFRENPEPLRISHFKAKGATKTIKCTNYPPRTFKGTDRRTKQGLEDILNVKEGNRFETVRRVAYFFGSLKDSSLLEPIKQAIESNSEFTGEEKKYLKLADNSFNAGSQKLFLN